MRFIPSQYLVEGMQLGKTLYNELGQVLLAEGVNLTPHYIQRIKDIGYNGVYISDDISKEVYVKEILSNEIRNKIVGTIKQTFVGIENKKKLDFGSIENLAERMVEDILENKHLMVNMIDLKVFDDYTFFHSVNVAVLSTVIGISIGLNNDKLFKLCLAALLHDIGKVFVPKELLQKPGKLTIEEYDLIKAHSEKGYEYIKNIYNIPIASYIGILHHHERWDGTGYPFNKKEKQISLFGRIIAIADVYDALTSDRPYRKALLPSEAMEYIMGSGGTIFDLDLVIKFSRRVAPYPEGTCVALSDGKVGMVIENFEDCCIRPKIKILNNSEEDIIIINLRDDMNYMNTTIVGIVRC